MRNSLLDDHDEFGQQIEEKARYVFVANLLGVGLGAVAAGVVGWQAWLFLASEGALGQLFGTIAIVVLTFLVVVKLVALMLFAVLVWWFL